MAFSIFGEGAIHHVISSQNCHNRIESFYTTVKFIREWGKIKQQPNNTLLLAFANLTRKLEQTAEDKLKTLGLVETMIILFCFAMAP